MSGDDCKVKAKSFNNQINFTGIETIIVTLIREGNN